MNDLINWQIQNSNTPLRGSRIMESRARFFFFFGSRIQVTRTWWLLYTLTISVSTLHGFIALLSLWCDMLPRTLLTPQTETSETLGENRHLFLRWCISGSLLRHWDSYFITVHVPRQASLTATCSTVSSCPLPLLVFRHSSVHACSR